MQGPETRASLIGKLRVPASQEAWTEFVELYRPLVIRVARAKGLQHADAEDLAQDVLATVGRAVDSFDPAAEGSFRGWLFKITRNLCINHLTRGRGPIGSGDSDVQRILLQLPADEATVTLFATEHRRMRFRQAAEALKPSFQESTWLSFWWTTVEGRSIESVAEALGKTNGSVRVARCRVLAKLKEALQQQD
ncbi:sigma-70 family RNA polymerase sigma factor [Aureliella helgolandensis]|uniref:sigma-70 family RNA polymerase sigma factor n=1 Tax=Aureliella helgolandensis TaxID=2527968 RepID=UPI001E4B41B0|nr:sigma-70 family RNA polymerase sigma factor [Aureliella helgolandensis]